MKFYAVMQQENEEAQVASFSLGMIRIQELMGLCTVFKLTEAVIEIPEGFTVVALNKLPQGGPTDGFMGAEDQDRLQMALDEGDYEVLDLDLDLDLGNLVLSTLHVSVDRIHVELVFSDTTWWSSPIMLDEVQQQL